jgi:hypothetical protein
MLDKREKTRDLIAILEAAVPFEVALTLELIERLALQEKPVVLKPIETVSKISSSVIWAWSVASSPRTPKAS